MANHREWIQEALAHRETEAVPYNFMFSPPARQKTEEYYGGSPIETHLDFPIRMSSPAPIKSSDASPDESGETVKDEYGVVWHTSDIDRGAPGAPCLTEPDLSGYTFPDPTAEQRFG
ncbi:MAG: hypothetical protein QF662_01300, partial [Phycisphaerae bacterium]|nr:hypothetical protein [Phycisphaerae bacterium]